MTRYIEISNHLFALLGFVTYSVILVWQHKQRLDKGEIHITWKQYFKLQWDDFLVMLLVGQVLALIQEYIAAAVAVWFYFSDQDGFWDRYIESQEVISFIIGALGVYILNRFFKLAKQKVDDFTE